MICPTCHQEIDEDAPADVREPVNIRGEKYVEAYSRRLAPGKTVWVDRKAHWTLYIPLVCVEKKTNES